MLHADQSKLGITNYIVLNGLITKKLYPVQKVTK